MAEDTSVAWKPSDYHTTSLGSWDPKIAFARHEDDETMNQQGMAFVTPNKLPAVYATFAAKQNLPGPQKVDGVLEMLNTMAEEVEESACNYRIIS